MDESQSTDQALFRCPTCDAVVPSDQSICLMCGTAVSHPQPPAPQEEPATDSDPEPNPIQQDEDAAPAIVAEADPVITSVLRERPTNSVRWATAVFFILLAGLGYLILRFSRANRRSADCGTPHTACPNCDDDTDRNGREYQHTGSHAHPHHHPHARSHRDPPSTPHPRDCQR